MEDVAGEHLVLETVAGHPKRPLLVVVVDAIQEEGDPSQLLLDGTHLQLGEAIENAVEDHVAKGQPHVDVEVALKG